jgi:triosephosphate isomerase (TIM)
MRRMIAGNWKMHMLGEGALQLAAALRRDLAGKAGGGLACDLLVCPPATVLSAVAHALLGSSCQVGAQDCHAEAAGAHTGDISAPMLRDAGATHVILGHSERRANHGETDAMVQAKVHAATAAGLVPIVCVGETLAEREGGWAESVVSGQLAGSLPHGFGQSPMRGLVAYEPVWAIGTGRTPTQSDIAAMHATIRHRIGPGIRILYGGSVKPENAAGILALPEVGGALVGGASLDAATFLAIAAACPA